MFISFFNFLRAYGLDVSMTEWLTLMEALEKGLHGSSFTGFYYLCRAVLLKSETEFDSFDQAFTAYFGEDNDKKTDIEEFRKWLEKEKREHLMGFDEERAMENAYLSEHEIQDMYHKRMEEQKEEHNGGTYWIGTGGVSVFGNDGFGPKGIRVMGRAEHQSAFTVAGERNFKDFRENKPLEMRGFQLAFRKLRQFAIDANTSEQEFDIAGTIRETGNNAGLLKIIYKKPRKNDIKVLLLIDSGGSMDYYSTLCSTLFHAVDHSNQFKDLKIYYFHNCISSRLFTDPRLKDASAVRTTRVLQETDGDYRVILLGDGRMNPIELFQGLDYRDPSSGLDWFLRFKEKYSHIIWLDPAGKPASGEEWAITYEEIEKHFEIYPLSVEGLGKAMKRLLSNR